jgi:hypothetical protein
LAVELTRPALGLLSLNDDGRYEVLQDAAPEFYFMLGRLIKLALINSDVFPITFTKPFYKQILGIEVGLEDLWDVNVILYNSLMEMKDNPAVDYGFEGFEADNMTECIK